MAKNCINPGCGKEIPSSATSCPFCGAQQVEDVQLSEEEKLRKEMSEMQKTMTLLKKALANAQQNSDSSAEKEQQIAKLQKQLADMQSKNKKEIKIMKKIVAHQKFRDFQERYGTIPASDKNNHLTKSRMLQGIYRNQKIENAYCNYVFWR
jgi:hypothetical protein